MAGPRQHGHLADQAIPHHDRRDIAAWTGHGPRSLGSAAAGRRPSGTVPAAETSPRARLLAGGARAGAELASPESAGRELETPLRLGAQGVAQPSRNVIMVGHGTARPA